VLPMAEPNTRNAILRPSFGMAPTNGRAHPPAMIVTHGSMPRQTRLETPFLLRRWET